MPTPADFQAWRDAYDAVAPDPAHFDEFAAKTSTMVHEFPGWIDELRSLQVPTLASRVSVAEWVVDGLCVRVT
jgi:hypothetical protein